MTSSPQDLPVITFPEEVLTPKSSSWPNTRDRVVSSLEKHGCFIAKYDKLSGSRKNLFDELKVIFDFGVTKRKNVSDMENHPVLRHEIPEATTEEGTKTFIKSMWPEGKNDMCKNILAYTRTAAALEEMVMKMVFESYRVDHPLKTGYIFRMMKDREVRLDFSDHEDRMEFLAVLDLSQVNGLEMKTKDGKGINVRPSEFLIMAGKPLTEWSKGKIHPLELKMHGNEESYSVGLFSSCNKDKNEVPKDISEKKKEVPKEQVESSSLS